MQNKDSYHRLERKHASQKKNIVIVGSLIALTFLIMGVIGYMTNVVVGVMILTTGPIQGTRGLLYPFESETREVRTLDGPWNFLKSKQDDPMEGVKQKWFQRDLAEIGRTIVMPVPASYNDITEDSSLRDHVGTVWYDRRFFVPKSWNDGLVWIRFGSVHYAAIVWINGVQVVEHQIGHLPFEAEISDRLKFGQENRITVLVDNTLISTTIPQGTVEEINTDDGVQKTQAYTFDFFNYAGIHRSVHLYRTPRQYIEDVILDTEVTDTGTGILKYKIVSNLTQSDEFTVQVSILDKNGTRVATSASGPINANSQIEVKSANLWWPYLMHADPGYLYELEVRLSSAVESGVDVYRMKFGFRTLQWTATQFLINGKPIYFRGFGKHEDSDIRGKGLDYALLTKDFNLLRWIGANAYRTSHYPYSEESMQFADENGIMVIDECPSVDTDLFSSSLLHNHKSSLEQLIHRDRNHPSVVMWSVANEPRTMKINADVYFKEVADYVRSLDSSRPVTAVIATPLNQDKAAKHMDIINFNRYNAWYSNPGQLGTVTTSVVQEAIAWHELHKKPVIMSEYGADTLEGLHTLPAFIWSEEYQKEILSRHFRAFDQLRDMGFFIGEFIWNFADFKTAQTYTRVGGNKKGIFLRNRQPKDSAFLVRQRYYALANSLDNFELSPGDLTYYIASNASAMHCPKVMSGGSRIKF